MFRQASLRIWSFTLSTLHSTQGYRTWKVKDASKIWTTHWMNKNEVCDNFNMMNCTLISTTCQHQVQSFEPKVGKWQTWTLESMVVLHKWHAIKQVTQLWGSTQQGVCSWNLIISKVAAAPGLLWRTAFPSMFEVSETSGLDFCSWCPLNFKAQAFY